MLGLGSTYSINKNAQNPDAAADFLDHLFSPQVQAEAGDEMRLRTGASHPER